MGNQDKSSVKSESWFKHMQIWMLALFSIFSFFFFFFLDTDTHYLIIDLEFNDVHWVYSLLGRLQPDKLKFELPAS